VARRSYTPEQRAQVLALLKGGAPVKRVARVTGFHESSVRYFRDHSETAAPAAIRQEAEHDLAGDVDRLRRLYLERAANEKAVATTSGYYAVIAAAKLTEVHQLLTGGPTARIDATPWGELMTQIRDARLRVRVIDAIGDGKEMASA
jgi:transposase-like protein